jgi:hypothetical protein
VASIAHVIRSWFCERDFARRGADAYVPPAAGLPDRWATAKKIENEGQTERRIRSLEQVYGLSLARLRGDQTMTMQSGRTVFAAGLITAALATGAIGQQDEKLGKVTFPTRCDASV